MKNLKQFREDYASKIKAKKEIKLKKGTTLKIMPQVPEKPDKALGVKESKESCSEGNYYCFDEKKCKPIPCLLYTSPSPRDRTRSRMPSSA